MMKEGAGHLSHSKGGGSRKLGGGGKVVSSGREGESSSKEERLQEGGCQDESKRVHLDVQEGRYRNVRNSNNTKEKGVI